MSTNRTQIEHRVGIQASADRIWELVSELDNWRHWNPVHPGAEGKIGFGQTLRIEEAFPGEERRTVEVKVSDWEPRQQLVWRTQGFMSVWLRYLEIDELGPSNCIFSNGVVVDGFLGKREAKKRKQALKLGFGILGEAIKEKAERNA